MTYNLDEIWALESLKMRPDTRERIDDVGNNLRRRSSERD